MQKITILVLLVLWSPAQSPAQSIEDLIRPLTQTWGQARSLCDGLFRRPRLPGWIYDGGLINPFWWRYTVKTLQTPPENIRHLELADGRSVSIGIIRDSDDESFTFCLPPATDVVLKLPRDPEQEDLQILKEQAHSEKLAQAGFRVAKVRLTRIQGVPFVVKDRLQGPTLGELVKGGLKSLQIEDLARIYLLGKSSGLYPDILGADLSRLVWDEENSCWVLVDSTRVDQAQYFGPLNQRVTSSLTTLDLYHQRLGGDDLLTVRLQHAIKHLTEDLDFHFPLK